LWLDRDTKCSHAFDEVIRTEGIKVIRTPVQAPSLALPSDGARTLGADCFERILRGGLIDEYVAA
jgi:hypothetical protein